MGSFLSALLNLTERAFSKLLDALRMTIALLGGQGSRSRRSETGHPAGEGHPPAEPEPPDFSEEEPGGTASLPSTPPPEEYPEEEPGLAEPSGEEGAEPRLPPPPPPSSAYPGSLEETVEEYLDRILREESRSRERGEAGAEPPAEAYAVEEPPAGQDRVLNAGFASVDGDRTLGRSQPLVSDRTYHLLVDIGPRWQDRTSLVVRSPRAVFPEEFLPRDANGYLVRVVFVSEDFTPQLVSGEMWVPSERGRSHPYADGERASDPGPVVLELRAPALRPDQSLLRAHGRLCLYCRGQLIQSAVVSLGVAREADSRLEEANRIEVDYVLTNDLSNVSERLGNRRARIQRGEEPRPVSVSLTLNEDGSGHHRILVTYHLDTHEESTLPPAWAHYDPQAAQPVLEESRRVIARCYKGLDKNFGKSRKDFGYDMRELAILGDRLRSLVLDGSDISGTGYATTALWRAALSQEMKSAAVVQIARTGPANYVFPWALIYQHPMPGPNYKLCRVINEWNENGLRNQGPATSCPYSDEPWHQQDIVCPYGFWGLKHVIEQPPGAVHITDGKASFDVTDTITARNDFGIGVGVTYDIDPTSRDQHILRLTSGMKGHLDPLQPAHDRHSALEMLHAPEIVYFLCHGEFDPNLTPYLSIGEHIDKPDSMIYPNTLEQWSRIGQGGLDIQAWGKKRPLVFINGCHTAALKPGVVLNFVSAFANLGASGVIGTEVSVLAGMAMVIAEAVLSRVGDGMEVGQAVREMRWEMLNRGNVLGLAYTPYSLAKLHLERSL